jgi:capsular exopolysaccharide synthesis family protein
MNEPVPAAEADITLRDYIDILRRRRAIFLQTLVVVLSVGIAVTLMSKPLYRTTARILVEGRALTVANYDANDPLSGLFAAGQGHDVTTQIEVLQSATLLADAYKDAGIPSKSARLQVKQVGDTDVIELIVESNVAAYATKLARAIPNTYLKYVTGNRKAEVRNALSFARARLQEETEKLSAAEEALRRFRTNSRVANLAAQRDSRISELANAENELKKAQAAVSGLQAKVSMLEATRRSLPLTIETPTTRTNEQIEVVKDRLDQLKHQRAGLLVLFKPGSAKIDEIDAQIAEVQRKLNALPPFVTTVTTTPNPALPVYAERIIEARAQLLAAQAEQAEAAARVANVGVQIPRFGGLEIRQAQLDRAVERHRETSAMLVKKVEDLSIREQATHDPVLTIAAAGSAIQVAPRKLNNMLYAAIAGIVLGLCFALLQEYLDDRINSPEDARRILDAPVLGYVPLIENEDNRLLLHSRSGAILESYRVVRSNVRFSSVDAPLQSILVSSTVPGEGKSVTACNLAVAMALDGKSVILVDVDLRRPTLHAKFELEQRPGITNVLVGQCPLAEALQETSVPGLRVLTSGPLPPNPAEILNSRAMRQVHDSLREMADVVIFDSPPFLASADAQVLSAEVDGVIYVIQFGEAKRTAVRHATELIRNARANILGVVFNKIDMSGKRDDFYYGYHRYYNYYSAGQLEEGRRRGPSEQDFEALVTAGGATAEKKLPGSGNDEKESPA